MINPADTSVHFATEWKNRWRKGGNESEITHGREKQNCRKGARSIWRHQGGVRQVKTEKNTEESYVTGGETEAYGWR